MDRKLNVLFTFLAIFVFILSAESPSYYWAILLGICLSFLFSLIAFVFQSLSLDGLFAATVIGAFVFGIGGWAMAFVVLLFFISSALISGRKTYTAGEVSDIGRRDGLQVWANGFWLVVCLVLAHNFENPIFLIGGLAAVAVATADTWATELRSIKKDSTYLITTFENVKPGTDGGISLEGTIWALAGSALIAGAAIYVFSLQLSVFFYIFIAGFLGSVIDSYFGATFQRNNTSVDSPFTGQRISISNNLVNALSTGVGALLAIILKIVIT